MLHRKWKECGDITAGAQPTTPHPYQRPEREHTHTHTHIRMQRWNKPVKKKKKEEEGGKKTLGVDGCYDEGKSL